MSQNSFQTEREMSENKSVSKLKLEDIKQIVEVLIPDTNRRLAESLQLGMKTCIIPMPACPVLQAALVHYLTFHQYSFELKPHAAVVFK